MSYYVELRYSVQRKHSPILLSMEELQYGRGITFRSVYAYDEATTEWIRSNSSSSTLQDCAVYSDTLFIDVDKEQFVTPIKDDLVSAGFEFTQWDTGNRGCHFHIKCKPMYGVMVPLSQRQWVVGRLGEGCIDPSIYRHSAQIRVPGAVHSKTGRVKSLIDTYKGSAVDIPTLTVRPPRAQTEIRPATRASYVANLTKYCTDLRHQHMMIIVKEGISLKLNYETILTDTLRWNSGGWVTDPLPDSAVEAHVRKTYLQHRREVDET